MPRLIDIEEVTNDRLEELLEYIQEAPVDISNAILHDELYELAYQSVMNDLIAEAEDREEERKLEALNDKD